MNEEVFGTMIELFGIEKGSIGEEVIDFSLSVAPYLAKAHNFFKFKRLEKRFKEHETQINRIKQKVRKLDEQPLKKVIQNTVFPYILDDLIEEHQEKKVQFILNGFEHIVDEKKSNEDYIISYYDALRDLRIEDIKRLLEYTRENNAILNHRRTMRREYLNYSYEKQQKNKKEIDAFFKEESYREHIDYKLESKGLIGTNRERYNEALIGRIENLDEKVNRIQSLKKNSDYAAMKDNMFKAILEKEMEYKLTSFGNTLIKVFNLKIEVK